MATNTSGVEGGYGGASGKKLMASGRFDGGPKEKYMRDTAVALQAMGEEVLIVTAGGGAKFGKQTMSCLYNMQIMVAFVTEDYGEKTDSAYCTFNEIEYCADHQKPVIPIKLYAGAWPPRPGGEGDAQNAFFFTPTLVYIDGVGKSAEELARAIVAAATDSHDAVTKREAAVAIQAAQRGKQARQAMRAGVVVENPLAAGGGGKGPAAQAQPQGASKGKVAAAIVMLLVAAIFIYLMEAPMAEAEAEAEAEAGVHCADQPSYCDCAGDCAEQLCSCAEAQTCCAAHDGGRRMQQSDSPAPAPTTVAWRYGAQNQACSAVCSSAGMGCEEGDWGVHGEQSMRVALEAAGQSVDAVCHDFGGSEWDGCPSFFSHDGVCFYMEGSRSTSCSAAEYEDRRLCRCV
jgi:hypothetical protein